MFTEAKRTTFRRDVVFGTPDSIGQSPFCSEKEIDENGSPLSHDQMMIASEVAPAFRLSSLFQQQASPRKRARTAPKDDEPVLLIRNERFVAPPATLDDPLAFADELRAGVFAIASDPAKMQRLIEDGEAEAILGLPEPRRAPSACTALVPAACEPRALALAIAHPRAPLQAWGVGRTTCTDCAYGDSDKNEQARCAYVLLAKRCGVGGCEAAALQLEREICRSSISAKRVRPDDVWVCARHGNLHVCTSELCDSVMPSEDGVMVCAKTGLVFEKIMIPDELCGKRQIEEYARSLASRDGCAGHVGDQDTPWQAARDVDKKRKDRVARKCRQRKSPGSKRQEKVTGVTAVVVAAAIADAEFGCIGGLANEMANRRNEELERVFGHGSCKLAPSTCFARAVEMATVAVVMLPVVAKAHLHLSRQRQIACAQKYGRLVWRAWTLVSALPGATDQCDAEVKFRHFSLGVLYHAKNGLSVKFDLSTVLSAPHSSSLVTKAVRSLLEHKFPAVADDRQLMEIFARKYPINFLEQDAYLGSRLVQENKIGTKNTVVDGVQIESVGVNAGMRLVKDGLVAVAEWAKRKFVSDLAGGLAPADALRLAVTRARDLLISEPKST